MLFGVGVGGPHYSSITGTDVGILGKLVAECSSGLTGSSLAPVVHLGSQSQLHVGQLYSWSCYKGFHDQESVYKRVGGEGRQPSGSGVLGQAVPSLSTGCSAPSEDYAGH